MKECPFGRTAVQAEATRLDTDMPISYREAIEMAKERFGQCTENCALWSEYKECCGILMIAEELALSHMIAGSLRAGAEDGA